MTSLTLRSPMFVHSNGFRVVENWLVVIIIRCVWAASDDGYR